MGIYPSYCCKSEYDDYNWPNCIMARAEYEDHRRKFRPEEHEAIREIAAVVRREGKARELFIRLQILGYCMYLILIQKARPLFIGGMNIHSGERGVRRTEYLQKRLKLR